MQNEWNPPPLAGQPMSISELLDEMALLALPDGTRVVTIDEARNELPMAIRLLNNLQSLQDQAHDLTEELEILVEALPPHQPHLSARPRLEKELLTRMAREAGRGIAAQKTLGNPEDARMRGAKRLQVASSALYPSTHLARPSLAATT